MSQAISFFLIISTLLVCSCNNHQDKSNNHKINILATIGDKIITVNDYIKRCEYVPRPRYCNGNNYIHKKISLNSLIAEKIFALEFENYNYMITPGQQSFIRGQKEQAMRHLMLKKFGYDKVEIDTKKINYYSGLINRTYDLRFIILDKSYNPLIKKIKKHISLNELIIKLNSDVQINSKTVTKNDKMTPGVENVLFWGEPKKRILYGPFEIDMDKIMCFEIGGWNTGVDITEKQKKESWEITKSRYKDKEAKRYYGNYVKNIMRYKSIQYNADVFEEFSKMIAKIYLIEKKKKEAVINNRVWSVENKQEFSSFEEIKNMGSNIILIHENKNYTVLDLLDLIKRHPLVFRNKTINSALFSNELKYAIADLFRDLHITNEAYALGLEKQIDVINIETKWNDYIKAGIIKNSFGLDLNLKNTPSKELTTKIDSLQKHYSNMIKIDTDKFEKIRLSTVDMSVIYSNQSYTRLEPDFPILTNDHILDYGEKVVFNE